MNFSTCLGVISGQSDFHLCLQISLASDQRPDHDSSRRSRCPVGWHWRPCEIRADSTRAVSFRCCQSLRRRAERNVWQATETRLRTGHESRDCGAWGVSPMIGLDTNVLVRYITQDEPRQAAKATKLVASLTPQYRASSHGYRWKWCGSCGCTGSIKPTLQIALSNAPLRPRAASRQ